MRRYDAGHHSLLLAAHVILVDMAEDSEEKIADMRVEEYEKDRRLNKEQSSENPDRVETSNRRADGRERGTSGPISMSP